MFATSIAPTVTSSDQNGNKNLVELGIPLSEIHMTGGNDEEFNGPSSFIVDNNKIYILDSVSSEIKLYDNNRISKTISIPGDYYFIDMDIDGDVIYLLDSNYRIVEYELNSLSIVKSLDIPKDSELSFSFNTGKHTFTGDYRPKYIKYDNGIHITFQNNKNTCLME